METEKYAIGLLELSCIHKGFEVQDTMLKTAQVEKLLARTICSGKFLIVVKGRQSDVEAAVAAGKAAAAYSLVNAVLIPNVEPKIFPAITGCTNLDGAPVDAMLVVETFSVASCIKAADIAVKTAEVDIVRIHIAMAVGGRGFFVLTGAIDALKSTLGPVLEFLKEEGSLIGYSLITQPDAGVMRDLV